MASSVHDDSSAQQLYAIIKKFDDWRGEKLVQIRDLVKEADPEITQEVKWKTPSNPDGVPVWYNHGMLFTGETYKEHLRISFAKGPELEDPKGLINSYRAMIIKEGDEIDEEAFKNLVQAAVELNKQAKNKSKSGKKK